MGKDALVGTIAVKGMKKNDSSFKTPQKIPKMTAWVTNYSSVTL